MEQVINLNLLTIARPYDTSNSCWLLFFSAVSLMVAMDTKDICKPAPNNHDIFRLVISTHTRVFLKV